MPPAPVVTPESVAESCTAPPTEIEPEERVVAIDAAALPTVSCSLLQALVAALLLASPEYTACQKYGPAGLTWENLTDAESGTTPLVTVTIGG